MSGNPITPEFREQLLQLATYAEEQADAAHVALNVELTDAFLTAARHASALRHALTQIALLTASSAEDK
jgi:hypothetical protein